MDQAYTLHDFFKSSKLSPTELIQVIDSYKRFSLKKHDHSLKEGTISNEVLIIETGIFRAFVHDTDGNEITTGFYSQSQIVIEVASFFLRVPTKENIQALTDCSGWRIDFNTFQHLFHSIEAFREFARSRLVQNLINSKQRTLSMITDKALDRYIQLEQQQPEVIQGAALKHIASYLGITDTSLSRIRKERSQSES